VNWTPTVLFLVAALLEAWTVNRYLRALRKARGETRPSGEIFLGQAPTNLFGLWKYSVRFGLANLRLVLTPQPIAAVERHRRVALIAMLVSIAAFVGVLIAQ
jgi:hypothetical protein